MSSIATKKPDELEEMFQSDRELKRFIQKQGGYDALLMRFCRENSKIMSEFKDYLKKRHQRTQ